MISVIMATKNGGKYIEKAIKSVYEQEKVDFEIIVVIDAATDNTEEILLSLNEKVNKIRVIKNDISIGPGASRNLAIKNSSGEYISIIDDDDVWISKDKLFKQKKFLDENPDVVLVGSSVTELVDENGKLISTYLLPKTDADIRRHFLRKNCFMTSTVMFRKSAYLESGGFPNTYLAEDYDTWLRMGLKGKFANLDGIEVKYMVRSGNASNTRKLELYKNTLNIIKMNRGKYPNYHISLIKAYLRIVFFHLKSIS